MCDYTSAAMVASLISNIQEHLDCIKLLKERRMYYRWRFKVFDLVKEAPHMKLTPLYNVLSKFGSILRELQEKEGWFQKLNAFKKSRTRLSKLEECDTLIYILEIAMPQKVGQMKNDRGDKDNFKYIFFLIFKKKNNSRKYYLLP